MFGMIPKWEGDRLCWGHQQMRLKDQRPPASGQYLLQHPGHPQVTGAAPFPACKAKWGITATKEPLVPAKQLYKPQVVAFTPRILFLEVRAAIRRKQHATWGLTHFLRCTDQQSTLGNAGKQRRELITNMRACNATICG